MTHQSETLVERALSPEATLSHVTPFLPIMGITRVADITGLDRVGVPVAMAVRPNARSISVSQGKGLSVAAAKAGAVMESIETWHAENIVKPLFYGAYEDLRYRFTLADPSQLPISIEAEFDPGERHLWIEATDYQSDEKQLVPFELVTADYSNTDRPGAGVFYSSTNGLASGNVREEALHHALLELIERDAVTIWTASGETSIRRTAVDQSTIHDRSVREILEMLDRVGLDVRIWDASCDTGIPVYTCLISGMDTEPAEFGSAAHPDPSIALASALLEAVQVRTTVISGSRDDIHQSEYEDEGLRARSRWAADMKALADSTEVVFPSARPRMRCSLDHTIGSLANAGLERVLSIDLSHQAFQIPVVRVIVPGLEGPWEGGQLECRPGIRLSAVLEKAAGAD